jgi:hypothetical protein
VRERIEERIKVIERDRITVREIVRRITVRERIKETQREIERGRKKI